MIKRYRYWRANRLVRKGVWSLNEAREYLGLKPFVFVLAPMEVGLDDDGDLTEVSLIVD